MDPIKQLLGVFDADQDSSAPLALLYLREMDVEGAMEGAARDLSDSHSQGHWDFTMKLQRAAFHVEPLGVSRNATTPT